MFSTSALKESRADAYYWRCLLAMIGLDGWPVIVYIEKTVAKALYINDIIKFLMGVSV
jgi:hypothetical protein